MITNREDLQVRNYLIWQREGCPPGRDWDHWFRAEGELAAEQMPLRKATTASASTHKSRSKRSKTPKKATSKTP